MAEVNEFGLPRDIPAGIKRQVRQRDGFGCVMCGEALIHYDHFDPEFKNAKTHTVEGIALLCGGHHDRKTRKQLSSATIAKARANPAALQMGFAKSSIDLASEDFSLVIGPSTFMHCRTIMKVWGDVILWIDPPEEPGAPLRLNATMYDQEHGLLLEIRDNEWRSSVTNWDVDTVGAVTTIRGAGGEVAIMWETMPPNLFKIHQMRWCHRGIEVRLAKGGPYIEIHGVFQTPFLFAPKLVTSVGGAAISVGK